MVEYVVKKEQDRMDCTEKKQAHKRVKLRRGKREERKQEMGRDRGDEKHSLFYFSLGIRLLVTGWSEKCSSCRLIGRLVRQGGVE